MYLRTASGWRFDAMPYAIGLIGPPLPLKPSEPEGSGGFAFLGFRGAVGRLWGLLGETRKKIGRHFVLADLKRTPVGVPTGPAGVVASGDAHVRVPELAAHVSELNPCRDELGREGVPQILRGSRASSSVSLHRRADA